MTSSPLLSLPFAVVDVETTGASAIYDRVIEIAVVRLERGQVVAQVESLVDPKMPVPPFITRLTGIDDRMVRGRPVFADLAPRIRDALAGAPFVAHNVSFDYGFVRHGFTRAGLRLDRPRLCTLRLARRLVPRLASYRLDALAAHFGIRVNRRHRALGDAEATAQVLLRLLEIASERGITDLGELAQAQDRPIARQPRRVDESVLEALPPGHGVYLLKDADGHVVYVGKSVHVRQRVREHLRGGHAAQPRLRRRVHAVVDVEAIETGSELEALFLESRLIKRYLPEANLLQRNDTDYPFIRLDVSDPFPRLEATREPPRDGALNFGPFRRRATAAGVVELLQDHLGLRGCQEPIRPHQSACALLDMGKCLGPCVGAVEPVRYRAVAQRAADVLRGRDGSLLDELIRRRDDLSEALRFEEAAELRDQIRELEHIVGVQRRLDAVSERNLVVIAPSARPRARELFFIRAGQLVRQITAGLGTRRTTVARALAAVYAAPSAAVTREKVDEMHLLDGWLRRHTERLTIVPVDPAEPLAALDTVVDGLRLAGPRKPSAAVSPPRSPHPVPIPSDPTPFTPAAAVGGVRSRLLPTGPD